MEKHYYYWAKENPFDEDSEMTIHCPQTATILEHNEACEELNELLNALHDTINAHKGIVPESAAKFISANVKLTDSYRKENE